MGNCSLGSSDRGITEKKGRGGLPNPPTPAYFSCVRIILLPFESTPTREVIPLIPYKAKVSLAWLIHGMHTHDQGSNRL